MDKTFSSLFEPEALPDSGERGEEPPKRRRSRRSAGSIIRSTLLNLAAVGGGICILLVILALAFNITLIMFKTGSMSPTIPSGSLAVVKQIPAAQAKVGQVVTIDQPGGLPVSHRVVSTKAAPHGFTDIVAKGDANPEPDPAPYRVKTVRLVVWSAPGLAYVVVWLGNPFVLGLLTLAVAALITWVLWPRSEGPEPRRRRSRREPERSTR